MSAWTEISYVLITVPHHFSRITKSGSIHKKLKTQTIHPSKYSSNSVKVLFFCAMLGNVSSFSHEIFMTLGLVVLLLLLRFLLHAPTLVKLKASFFYRATKSLTFFLVWSMSESTWERKLNFSSAHILHPFSNSALVLFSFSLTRYHIFLWVAMGIRIFSIFLGWKI